MRVFVTGGTGLIGPPLIQTLRSRRHEVLLLTRRPGAARTRLGSEAQVVEGDPTREGPWMDAAAGCEAVVNLAGENIFARRWSDDFKRAMRDSRVQATHNVVKVLGRQPRTASGEPKVLVNASAVGYYGPHGDEEIDESTPPGRDTLARICVDWEQAARQAEPLGCRVALVRTGVVLDRNAGALAKLLPPFRFGMGGPVGSGQQWMPWIHHADIVGIFALAVEDSAAAGPINGTAPGPVRNQDFGKALGAVLHRPAFLPTPAFGLRLMLGEVADVILEGQRALPRKAESLGYAFRFPTLDAALADILK